MDKKHKLEDPKSIQESHTGEKTGHTDSTENSQPVEESYQCEQCHELFDNEDDFLEHIFTAEHEDKPADDKGVELSLEIELTNVSRKRKHSNEVETSKPKRGRPRKRQN